MKKPYTWILALMIALGVALTGCAAADRVSNVMPRFSDLEEPMKEAVQALQAMEVHTQQGDGVTLKETYKSFASAFGEVLGPIRLKDSDLAQRMVGADGRLRDALNGDPVAQQQVMKEARFIMDYLQDAALALGGSLMTTAPAVEAAAPPVITVTAKDFRFEPSHLEMKAGEPVVIRLANAGTQRHEWEIEALDFEIGPIEPGATSDKVLKIDKPGTYEFICDLDNHKERGMVGTLIVK